MDQMANQGPTKMAKHKGPNRTVIPVDQNGRTMLHQVLNGFIDDDSLVEHMIKCGFNVNLPDNDSVQPLHTASEKGFIRSARKLVECSAQVDSVNSLGCTPLMLAVKFFHPDVVQFLLDHGAKTSAQNNNKETPLHFTSLNKTTACLEILLQFKSPLNIVDSMGVTPLSLACKYKNVCIAKEIVKAGANPNLADNMGNCPLHFAAGCPEGSELVQDLIKAGADLDVVNTSGESPMAIAIKANQYLALEVLLKGCCDVSNLDGLNATATSLATLYGHTRCMKTLLEHGEDPDEVGYFGITPLMSASYQSNAAAVDMLLQFGADPNIVSRTGHSALFTAIVKTCHLNERPRHDIIKQLLRANAYVNQRLGGTVFYTVCGSTTNCPVVAAIFTGYLSIVRLLLLSGAYVPFRLIDQWKERNPPAIIDPLCEWFSNVQPLSHLCRNVIRRSIHSPAEASIDSLALATPVKKYLNFDEFDDIKPDRFRESLENDVSSMINSDPGFTTDLANFGLASLERCFGFMTASY